MWGYRLDGLKIDYSRLDEELKELANDFVRKGIHPDRDDPYMDEWARWRAEQIFPPPGRLPAPPRRPSFPQNFMALVGICSVVPSVVAIAGLAGAGAKYQGILAAVITFWICYVALWFISSTREKRYYRAKEQYWTRYDPHHEHRDELRSELARRLGSEINEAWYEFGRPVATVPASHVPDRPRRELAWTPCGPQPSAMASCNDRQAEFLARDWMLFLGESGCQVSPATRDGGADVVSGRFVAEVKHHAAPVGPALVRQIFGVATAEGKTALFFSLSGYSSASIEFGEQVKMALFVYDFTQGTLDARTPAAELALLKGLPSLSR
ncbi:restriction endonuclease [Paenarthrobacter sp. NEAU-H11]|uniref:restriction endonuclease n=1 Tax=Paenarthrobacter sp. NEAU-H11 TaxID=3423924 RepID=UPI003D345515